MAVLYQKYRPQRFSEVVGQDAITRTLLNASAAGELAHAYLFTGSRGVGKTTIARILAKAANCPNLKNGDPCGKCEVCTAIANGSSLDVIEIDAASNTGVDNVRELIEHAQFRPTVMKTKVFIIDEVHMLSKAAFNALLKTLEEPPAHVLFILATTDIEKVPETIISRTQRYDFKRIVQADMLAALEVIAKDQKLKLPKGVLEAVAGQSEGSMRDALSKLNMVASLGDKVTLEDAQRLLGVTPIETVQTLISKIATNDAASLPEFFEDVFASGADSATVNRSILEYLRELLNAKLAGQSGKGQSVDLQNEAAAATFAQHSADFSVPKLLFIVRLFLRSYKEIAHAPSPDLPLLLAAVEASLHGAAAADDSAAGSPAKTTPAKTTPVKATSTKVATAKTATAKTVATKATPAKSAPEQAVSDANVTADASTASDADIAVDTNITLEEIKGWWPDVISRVKAVNSPIATLLKNSPITEVIDGKITVAVKYLFHKEHLDSKKHNSIITEAITEVSGKNLVLKAVINKEVKESSIVTTMDSINDALKVFGGELVD